jgi:hypothetical protein
MLSPYSFTAASNGVTGNQNWPDYRADPTDCRDIVQSRREAETNGELGTSHLKSGEAK